VSRRFWPRHSHSGPGANRVHPGVLFYTMDCARDPGRRGWCQQGNRHLFIRDGRDRGKSRDIGLTNNLINQYQVFSEAAPFTDSTPTSVVAKVLLGARPERPNNPMMTDELWDLTRRCLEEDPRRRPEIVDVVSYLRAAMVTQKGRVCVADVKMDDMTGGRPGPWGLLSPFVASSEAKSMKGTRYSGYFYLLWRPFKPRKSSPQSGHPSDKSKESR
jgi:serine/threonine protein kinase